MRFTAGDRGRATYAVRPIVAMDRRIAHELIGDARGVGEQVEDGDGTFCRNGPHRIAGCAIPYLQVSQLGKIDTDWVIECQLARFRELQDRDGRDRFRHRIEPEDRIPCDRLAALDVRKARCDFDEGLSVLLNQYQSLRQFPRSDHRIERRAQGFFRRRCSLGGGSRRGTGQQRRCCEQPGQ